MDDLGFGDGWEPDPRALAVVADYLVSQPEQGDWPWRDHCEGLAGGILHALHGAGIDVPGQYRPPDPCGVVLGQQKGVGPGLLTSCQKERPCAEHRMPASAFARSGTTEEGDMDG